MQIKKRAVCCLSMPAVLGLLLTPAAYADDGFSTTINGYGTIGGTYSGNSALTYIQDQSQFKNTNSQFDLGLDSRIGAQANFAYGDKLSVIVQEEAKRRGSDNFSLGTEWAFLQYTPIEDLKLRFGRVALQSFLMSDTRDVGYAQPWFHEPNEVYGALPYHTLDGGEALWHVSLGKVGLDLTGEYGTTSAELEGGGLDITISAKYVYNVAATLTYSDFLVRVSETTFSIPLTLPLGPQTTVKYELDDKFLAVGFQYDNGKALLLSEWAKRSENNVPLVNLPVTLSSQWYVAGGWRFGKFTPLVNYSSITFNPNLTYPQGTYRTPSVSLRYDIVTNVALKAEASRAEAGNGYYWNTDIPKSTQRVNVFGLGADFIF